MTTQVDIDRLQSNIQWAVNRGLGRRELVPMLEQLVRHAEPGSAVMVDAHTQLAELFVEERPWQSALYARQALRHREDDRLYAVLGLAYTLLGHHRCARQAYRQALALAPRCPSYAHNLGHLLDVAFQQPKAALYWLHRAQAEAPDEPEIHASYAHALVRAGMRDRAVNVLRSRLRYGEEQAQSTLDTWLRALPAP